MPERERPVTYPLDPLAEVVETDLYKRSLVSGVLESYNSNYDFLAEAVQNAVDAIEDAKLKQLDGPFHIAVTINLKDNYVSVLDTGVGMTEEELTRAVAPHVSLKSDQDIVSLRGKKHSYRGYKGVGLTLLAYGTDDLRLHSKRKGEDLVALRMRYGNAWARGERQESALVDKDGEPSPLESLTRGTFVRLQFSPSTRPRSLASLTSHTGAWAAILRTRTAIGQVLFDRDPIVPLDVSLSVVGSDGGEPVKVEPHFLFPSDVVRKPAFRFLDVGNYYEKHPQISEIPTQFKRQDGVYMKWDTERIRSEYTKEESQRFKDQLDEYSPSLYAFVPYQGGVWSAVNEIISQSKARTYLSPGMILAINRQRLADLFPIVPTRYATFSRNVMVVVHFDGAKPDQGRKTVQDEVLDAAKAAANRAVQFLANQRSFLRPIGEKPSEKQRQVERNKQDWEYNVRNHHEQNPLHIPPVTYDSEPLTEQDVVGLFHQLSALGVFPGMRILATSQIQTYDSIVFFRCDSAEPGLRFGESPLGLAPSVIGEEEEFQTHQLTLEFKNNLDSLIADMDDEEGKKQYQHIDICICWDKVQDQFPGYELSLIEEDNLDQRSYPGTTHFLKKDGDTHTIEVVMLSRVRALVEAGELSLG